MDRYAPSTSRCRAPPCAGSKALRFTPPRRPLRPCLLHIAGNLARNRRRFAGRYLAALRRLVAASPPPITESGERSGAAWEAHTLWQAVRKLRPAEQEVIYLRYFLDLSEA